MILEETLLFYKDEEADAFVKFLRTRNCRAQKYVESMIFEEDMISGTIGNMTGFARDIIGLESNVTPPVTDSATGLDALIQELSLDEGGREHQEQLYGRMVSNLMEIRDHVGDIMSRFNPGDIIGSVNHLDQLKKKFSVYDEASDSDAPEDEDTIIKDFTHELFLNECQNILKKNLVAEATPDGLRLIKKIEPDDLIIERRLWNLQDLTPERQKKFPVTQRHLIYYDTAIRLVIDLRVHFTFEPDEIEDAIEHLEVDDKVANTMIMNMFRKNLVVDKVMKTIKTADRISLAELIDILDDFSNDSTDEGFELNGYCSPAFVTGIINDLKKVGLLEGNDRKIRVR